MFELPSVCAVSREAEPIRRPAPPDRKTPGGKTIVCKGNENLILQRKCSSAAWLLAHRLKQLSIDQIFAFSFPFFLLCAFAMVSVHAQERMRTHIDGYIEMNAGKHTHTQTHTLSFSSSIHFHRRSILTL